MSSLLTLDQIDPRDRLRVGGKGAHLAHLHRKGLPVPPAVVLPVNAFRDTLAHNDLADADWQIEPAALRERILGLTLDAGLETQLVAAARRLGGRLAVRSSAIDEDGQRRSFAGQHLTLLGVRPEEVVGAVRRVWASLYSDEALAYRGGRPRPGTMAVVVQRLIEARTSGVLFTVNPLTGSWREMTVEATWGLGEGLVSGQVTPHWYLVRRPAKSPRAVQRVTSRVRLHLMQQDTPDIPDQWQIDEQGAVVVGPTPSHLKRRPTLDKRALMRLCRLALKAEWELGEPLDVEWAFDHRGRAFLLQARPITTTGNPRERQDVLWTRRFIGERWPEPATPLGWSLIRPVLEHFIAYPDTQSRYLGGGPALRLVNSRPYLNASAFQHLAFKLPGAPPPRFMLELVPPSQESAWHRRFGVLPDLSVYGSFLRETFVEQRWQRFRWNPLTNPRHWDAFAERLAVELPRVERLPVSPTDALRLVQTHLDLVRDYVGIHVCSLLFANLFYQLLEGALSGWTPEHAASYMRRIAVCPPGNRTVETNGALWDLAQAATEDDLDALEQGRPTSRAFEAALHEFLYRYGHRSHASWELMAERWRDDPARLVPLLRSHRRVEAVEPEQRVREQEHGYEQAMAALRREVGPARLATLEVMVNYTRQYLLLRENQRFAFDQLLYSMRRSLVWLGGWLVEQGALTEQGDIAFLTWDEVEGLARGTLPTDSVQEWVGRRRAQRERDLAIDPPVFLRGDTGLDTEASGARLQGLGISPGRARGAVRVIRTLEDAAKLQPGEIIVAHAIDPGWTPLLISAGGIVLEMGSRLSHGAVVAREYGLPAVVNLEGVTRSLRDGQEVTIDGTRGILWQHP